jgi:peptide/nickel transport system substrate-binding protein
MVKQIITSKQLKEVHPYLPEAYDKLLRGKVSRREFIRTATLLGMSAGLAACAPSVVATEEAVEPTAAVPVGGIQRGGTWTSGMELQLVDHPARLAWGEGGNIVRQVAEYLTEIGPDNITRPHLLEKWSASEDLKTWTLSLQKGIKFNNGDELTADDVLFNFSEWLNPDVGSSLLGTFSYLSGMQDVEKVDDYTLKLHLGVGNIAVPEHLFSYPAAIIHRNFEGDFIKQPIGTGPFTLVEYAEGERAVFKRREDYWRMGEDGKSLPYLDELIYVSLDKDAAVAALQSGQIDTFYQPRPSDWQALKDFSGLMVRSVSTAQNFVLRMRMDVEPWTDVRVRNALKMCQDREKILQLSYYGEGDLAIDAHVAPIHPDYCEKEIPKYDPEGSKALLTEAGYPDGLKVTLATKNDLSEPEMAQALKELAAPGGFDIELDITDPGGYWDRWMDVDLGITAWTHRPLGTMVLRSGYSTDDEGNPVPWNETRFADEEFNTLLVEAESTLDIEARREIMCKLEDIMQERGPIGISFWKNAWNITKSEFKNITPHPTDWDLLTEVWKDSE